MGIGVTLIRKVVTALCVLRLKGGLGALESQENELSYRIDYLIGITELELGHSSNNMKAGYRGECDG